MNDKSQVSNTVKILKKDQISFEGKLVKYNPIYQSNEKINGDYISIDESVETTDTQHSFTQNDILSPE